MSAKDLELADDVQQFIRREIAEGRFGSASEVIEAGLHLLEERETRLAALRKAIAEGERAAAGSVFPSPRKRS